jgi:hypothetical protein
MSKSARTRRGVALIAAYVIALQALLLPLSVAAGGPFAGSLCASVSTADGSSAPAGHEQGCPCAGGCGMQCCAVTFVVPPQVVIALHLPQAVAVAPPSTVRPIARLAERSPQIPRAPPVA